MGLKDFFTSAYDAATGTLQKGLDLAKRRASDTPERVLNTSAEQPKAALAQPAAPQAGARAPASVQPQGSIFDTVEKAKVQSGIHNPASTPLGKTVQGAVDAVQPNPTAPASANPNVRPGAASPEAQAFRAQGGGAAAPAQVVDGTQSSVRAATAGEQAAAKGARGGFMRAATAREMAAGALRRAGAGVALRRTGLGLGAIAALDAGDKVASGDTVEQRAGKDPLSGALAEFGDTVGLGYGRELGTALGAGVAGFMNPGVQDKGLLGRFKSAGRMATQGFEDAAAAESATAGLPAVDARAAAVVPPRQREKGVLYGDEILKVDTGKPIPEDLRTVENVHGEPRTADDLVTGTDVPAPGTGAFRVGNNQARVVDSRGARGAEATPALTPGQKAMGGYVGAMAGYNARHREKSSDRADAEVGIKKSRAQTDAAKVAGEQRATRAKDVESEAKDEVTRRPDIAGISDPKEREARAQAETADLTARLRRSAAGQGKELGDLDVVERRQLHVADKFRRKLEKQRGGLEAFVRDFSGNKRVDSDDLYTYIPAKVESGTFGKVLTMRNGNQVRVEKVVRNGETSWVGPNGPIDADMLKIVEEVEKDQEKKKRPK